MVRITPNRVVETHALNYLGNLLPEYTIQLCFEVEGQLNGVEKSGENTFFLSKGNGEFINGKDKITFGPGVKLHEGIRGLEGEKYSVLNGNLNTPGQHVYLTGYTPFKHTVKFS